MSAEAFGKLSLEAGEMVTTRAGAARAPHVIESSISGLRYNVDELDNEARKRAGLALDDNAIKMKYCMQSAADHDEYIFHIDDEITVGIGGRFPRPKCNCGANDGDIACKHIFWLEDQLTRGAPDQFKSNVLQLKPDGSTVHDMQPAQMIERMSLGSIAEGLEWVLHDGSEFEDDDAEEQINEMLSAFEPSGAFPAEFKAMSDTTNVNERSRKYKEFAEIVTNYATGNLGLVTQLKQIIDPTFLAHTYIDKINDRTRRTFQALDEYVHHGPRATPPEAYDVVTCAERLKILVTMIDEFYDQQVKDVPGSKEVAIRVAASLITILEGVADRNRNAYEGITWGGLTSTDPAQNNLFVYLIGAPADEDGLFVLDVLSGFPQENVLRTHWDALSSIAEKLSRNGTPSKFMNEFRKITPDSRKRSYPEAGGSSAKRPMK